VINANVQYDYTRYSEHRNEKYKKFPTTVAEDDMTIEHKMIV
jgi:hypothetical protein